MADAFSHLVSSLGYMRQQEREVLSAMFGAGRAMEVHSSAAALPISKIANGAPGLHVAAVKMNAAVTSTAVLNPTATKPSRSASGTAVAAALTHARPSAVMQPSRSVAVPSGGSKSLRPIDASMHPMLRPSGSVVVPLQRTVGPTQQTQDSTPTPTPNIPLPSFTLPSNDGGVAGSYTMHAPADDSGSANGTSTDTSTDTSAMTPVASKTNSSKWIFLVGGGLFAAWLFFGRSNKSELANG